MSRIHFGKAIFYFEIDIVLHACSMPGRPSISQDYIEILRLQSTRNFEKTHMMGTSYQA